MMRESDILFQIDCHWVGRESRSYTVLHDIGIVSESDSSYARNLDGLSLAICRAMYLATGKGLAREALGYATHILNDSAYRPQWSDVESFLADAAKLRAAYDARLQAANNVAKMES